MRECARCGQTYHRRDRVEVWTSRNPGHRAGWRKQIVKLCLTCSSAQQSRRLLMLVSVRLGGHAKEKKRAG